MLCGFKRSGPLAVEVSNNLAMASPVLQLADQSHQLQQQFDFHHSLSGQLSQHAELSQGSYPPWLLHSSNPGLCIPDSVGTQSPLQRDRQLPAITAASPMATTQQPNSNSQQLAAANLQQQEAHKRNAAALQELMTQADASEPDADDFVADSAADHAAADVVAKDRADTVMQSPAIGAAQATEETSVARLPVEHAEPAEQLPQGRADASRGAGTPAGPQEEFYSPQEHFHGEASEQHDVLVPPPTDPEVHTSIDDQTRPAVNDLQVSATADDQARPVPSELTPLSHKTPAPSKRRKGSKRYCVTEGCCGLLHEPHVDTYLCRRLSLTQEWSG